MPTTDEMFGDESDFRISDKALEAAEKLADAFKEIIKKSHFGRLRWNLESTWLAIQSAALEYTEQASLDDVAEDTLDFAWQHSMVTARNVEMPVMQLDDGFQAPFLARGAGWGRLPRNMVEWFRGSNESKVRYVHPEEALDNFTNGLRRFLGFRFEGFNLLRSRKAGEGVAQPGMVGPGMGGFHVKLDCTDHNLRAHASPAYGIAWSQFGYPTKPVMGILPPGVWIFGADGGPYSSIVPDISVVRIPTNFTPCAIAF